MVVVGDTVKISKNSNYYNYNTKDNPKDMEGIVTEYNSYIMVKWSNGWTNSYYEKDLEIIKNRIYELWN